MVRSDRDTAVHHELGRRRSHHLAQTIDSSFENPGRNTAPPGVKQRDRPRGRVCEIHGNAVRHRHGQQDARQPGDVAVVPIQNQPSLEARFVFPHLGSVRLQANDDSWEFPLHGLGQRGPPRGHRIGGVGCREAEIEAAHRAASSGDAGNQAVHRVPPIEFGAPDALTEHGEGLPLLGHDHSVGSILSMWAPNDRSRSSIRS